MSADDRTPRAQWHEIVVQGHLDDCRVRSFGGLTITLLPGGETMLSGPVLDQAALHGILSRIRDMGLPLLAVRRRDAPQAFRIQQGASS